MADKKASEKLTGNYSSRRSREVTAKNIKVSKVSSRAQSRQKTRTIKSVSKSEPKSASSKGLTVNMVDITGRSTGQITLPKETFGQKPNARLLAIALRVYRQNSKPKTANTKTRAEVRGGGVKPWRQKGTGRARAGSIRSPLWVGGGITFGPRFHQSKLTLPKKMRRKALVYALSSKAQEGNIRVISNLEKITPKTKIVSNLLLKIQAKKPLIVTAENNKNVRLASRNIPQVLLDSVAGLNAFKVLKSAQILLSKEAVTLFTERSGEAGKSK